MQRAQILDSGSIHSWDPIFFLCEKFLGPEVCVTILRPCIPCDSDALEHEKLQS